MRCSDMKKLLLALALFLLPISAEAATCFAVNTGAGVTWSTGNGVMWASSSGGTASTCAATGGVPKQSVDIATFDGASGGGTVTVDSTMNGTTISSLVGGAFTGTLDFSVNNPSMTFAAAAAQSGLSFSGAGTGRILKLGTGTFTFNNGNNYDFTTTTGAGAQSLAGATLVFNGASSPALVAQATIALGGFAYGTITINGRGSGQAIAFLGGVSTWTATTINLNAGGAGGSTGVLYVSPGTIAGTVSNLNITGSIAQPVVLQITTQNTQLALTVTNAPSIAYAAIRNINFVNAANATNSWDLGENTNLTATPPSPSSGGGHIIGG
jgi:hypothetical protein